MPWLTCTARTRKRGSASAAVRPADTVAARVAARAPTRDGPPSVRARPAASGSPVTDAAREAARARAPTRDRPPSTSAVSCGPTRRRPPPPAIAGASVPCEANAASNTDESTPPLSATTNRTSGKPGSNCARRETSHCVPNGCVAVYSLLSENSPNEAMRAARWARSSSRGRAHN